MTTLGSAALLNGLAVVQVALRLVHLTLMARLMPPEAFGLAAMALVSAFMVSDVGDLGMGAALVRRKTVSDRLVSSVFWAQALAAGTLAAAVSMAAEPLAELYGRPDAAPLFAWAALVLPFTGLASVPRAMVVRARRFGTMVVCEVVALAAGIGGSLALALSGWGAEALVAQQVLHFAVRAGAYAVASGFRPVARPSLGALVGIFPFSRGILGAQLVDTVASYADRWIVGTQLGAAALGLYQQAYTINQNLAHVVSSGPNTAIYPVLSRLQGRGGDLRRLRRAYLGGTRMLAAVALPAFAGLAAVAEPAVTLLLGAGQEWDWSPAAAVLRAICLAGAVQALTALNGPLLMALDASGRVLAVAVICTVCTVTGLAAGTRFGLEGAGLGYAAAFLVSGLLGTWLALRTARIGFGDWLRCILRPLACALGMALAVAALDTVLPPLRPVARLAILVPAGILLYALPMHLLDRSLLRDLRAGLGGSRR